jgi:LacI family transcriptional regulator
VLNDGPRPVAAETRARVQRAIEELDYRPNHVARSLRSRRSLAFGLLVPEPANPFFAEVAKGIEDESYGHGYTLTVGNTNGSAERRLAYTESLIARRVDALFFDTTGISSREVDRLERAGILSIYLGTADELDDDVRERLACVTLDTDAGGYAVGRLFIEHGHTRIATIGGTGDQSPYIDRPWQRVAGFLRAIHEAGLESRVAWGGSSPSAGYAAASELLVGPTRPTAIFAGSDYIAIGVLRRAADLGLRVPDDLAVCGFDDIEIADHLIPRLTTVRVPKLAMGQLAARIALDALASSAAGDPSLDPSTRIAMDVELILRESV